MHQREPRLTSSQRLTFAATLCAIAICALTCASCAGLRVCSSPLDEYNGTVKILTSCVGTAPDGSLAMRTFGGSGVVVSGSLALTAAHVVTCPDGTHVLAILIDAEAGVEPLAAEVETLIQTDDIARIRVVERGALARYYRHPRVGPRPEIGDRVCESSALPRLTYRCGTVDPSPDTGPFMIELFVEHGNSGSGLWADGRLVGIVIAESDCERGIPCVGWVTPLQNHRGMVP